MKEQKRTNGFEPRNGKHQKYPFANTSQVNLKQNNGAMRTKRGDAIRANKRSADTATKAIDRWNLFEQHTQHRANKLPITEPSKLRVIPIGGQEGGGATNMVLIEYENDAIIIDCGFNLSVDLPGINYGIASTHYLDSIKHKIRGYVFTHGHLDHIGAIPYVIPKHPAPVYGSHFTIGMIKKQFEGAREYGVDFTPECVEINMDNHQRLVVGCFTIELVRVTHSIPESSVVVIDTPVGRVINTGDFRLDPEPLDHMPTDIQRLEQLGKEGVLLLLSESTTTYRPGRTPTEHTLQPSFTDLIKNAHGRVFVAIFSSNINRTQMIINAAVEAGRKVAFDGRSMIAHAELAVRLGILKVPKGYVMAMRQIVNQPDNKILVVCTGGQGEPNAALQRMSIGEHKHIKLRSGDTVVVSSTPIPGNEVAYEQIGDDLTRQGVHLYRAPTHEIDGCGPLHTSGHASREEFSEMIRHTKPKLFMPIYGGPLNRKYHIQLAKQEGLKPENCFMAENGDVLSVDQNSARLAGNIGSGTLLVDQTGAIVPGLVAKDRLIMSEEGIVVTILTVNKKTGKLLTSPDIITRGFIYIRDNTELMEGLRTELKRACAQRFLRVDIDRFKQELKDHITHYLYEHTRRSPTYIPVVNVVGGGREDTNKLELQRAELLARDQPD